MSDDDLFLSWAAEEFVAAGRASDTEQRRLHRRQAEFFADVVRELGRLPDQKPGKAGPEIIGQLLAKAFSEPPSPQAKRHRPHASALRLRSLR